MKYENLIGIILAIFLCVGMVSAGDPFSVDENLEMGTNDVYNATNINATNIFQDGSKVLDVDDVNGTTFNYTLHANSSTYWASVSSFVNKWFYDFTNVFSFNETLLNSTIDARSDFDTRWSVDDEWVYNKTGDLSLNLTSGDARYYTQSVADSQFIEDSSEGDLNVNYSVTSGTATTWDGETSQADLNVNYSVTSGTAGSALAVAWSAITDKFITTVDDVYIYMSGSTATFNITKAGTDLAVNSSDYWDALGSPSDISAGDIIDDGTYYNKTSSINATGYNVTATNFYGSYDWTSGDSWNTFDGSELLFNTSMLSTTYYNASLVSVITGTGAGLLSNIQEYDGISYNVTETNSDYELLVNFTGIVDFTTLIIRHKVNVDSGHSALIQVWDYNDSDWEDYGLLTDSETYEIKTLGVYDSSDHVSGGVVQLRFYQVEGPPNTANIQQFDWVAISKGFGTPVGQEIDPLSIHKDGNVGLTGNWDVGAYNITALKFISDIATGTSPFDVSSTTVVTDLNANMVEGTDLGTLSDGKACTYDSAGTEIDCDTTLTTGTVTSVATTEPITGGTITGSGTISLIACNNGEGYVYNSTSAVYECTALGSGTGSVTSVGTDDTYLTGGTITGSGTITFNETLAGTSLAVNSSDYWDALGDPTDITSLGTISSADSITSTALVGPLTGNADSATLWASVSSFIEDWFYDNSNVFTLNETKLTAFIEAFGYSTTTGTVTSVTGTSPIISSEGTTPAISATIAKDLITTAPITGAVDDVFLGTDSDITIAMPVGTSSADGYLNKDDWTTFNNKADSDTTYTAGDGLTLTSTEFKTTYAMNQNVMTTSNPTFNNATITNCVIFTSGGMICSGT